MLQKTLLKNLFTTLLLLVAVSAEENPSSPYSLNLSNMLLFGSGCPDGTVNVISSTDGKTVTVLFSNYYAQTSDDTMFDRKSCNVAVPFQVSPSKQISLHRIDYRGYTYIPEGEGSETNFGIEYFFAGTKGPIVTRSFTEEEDIVITDEVPIAAWSSCGGSEIFRINTSIKAKKENKDDEDAFIAIDSVDSSETNTIALVYYFNEQDC